MSIILRLFCLFLVLVSSAAADSRQKLEHFLADLHTLKARFNQQVIHNDTGQVTYEQGLFYLSRPNHFRWVYEGDYPRYIIADGRIIWLVEEDLEQVSQRFQKSALKGTPAGLFADEKLDIDQEFKVKDLGERMGLDWLKLIPKEEDSPFQDILLAFDGDQLHRMEMTDQFGQVTRFDFYDVQRNLPLPKDLFQFAPPPGYDILDQ